MLRPQINWSEMPPDPRPKLRIVRAPIQSFAEWLVLSDTKYGCFLHWDKRLVRNVPCTDPYGCICQDGDVGTRWVAYLCVQELRSCQLRLLELSSEAWLGAEGEKLLESRGSLRGMVAKLSRFPHTKQGRITVEFRDLAGLDPATLPPAANVRDELERIWYSKR